MGTPQQPRLPRWVIPTAVAGAVVSLALLIGFAGSVLWMFTQVSQVFAVASSHSGVPEASDPIGPDGRSDVKPDVKPDGPGTPGAPGDADSRLEPPGGEFSPDEGPASVSGQLAIEIQALADSYLEAQRDGTIYSLVPGGDRVDPNYVGAFLYALTDLKSASRFGGTTAELQELLDKAKAYESRFLAGEDLDVTVRITRADGSVFASDGVYRLVE